MSAAKATELRRKRGRLDFGPHGTPMLQRLIQLGGTAMLKLVGRRIELREFDDRHRDDLGYRSWLRDLEVVRPLHLPEYLMPMRGSELDAYVDRLRTSGTDCYFAIHLIEGGAFVGTCRLGHLDWRTATADVGVLIGARDQWGKGYATDAVRVACTYAFDELGLRRVSGGTPSSNVAMVRCFEKIGFKHEGRRRQSLKIGSAWVDHELFGLFPGELVRERGA